MKSPTHNTHTFHVSGMHCDSCVLMIESELQEAPGIRYVRSSLRTNSVEVAGDFGDMPPERISDMLSQLLEKHGYRLSTEKPARAVQWSDFKMAIPLALGFVILFVVLQKAGIVNLVQASRVSYGTAFVVGVVASLSTCMAVVGGLVLSMSAAFAKGGDRFKPQALFHLGRIVSFFILGGVIGAIGSAFTLNVSATFALNLGIGIVMLILGLNLLDTFHFTKKLQPSMPRFLSKHALGISAMNHRITPLLVGAATFFLPCGFTQSMQIYTLSTGNFLSGGLTMLSFALGTLPVLALVSFSSWSIRDSSKSGIFFKTAGLVVISFAIFNIINSMVVIGLIRPVFNF